MYIRIDYLRWRPDGQWAHKLLYWAVHNGLLLAKFVPTNKTEGHIVSNWAAAYSLSQVLGYTDLIEWG